MAVPSWKNARLVFLVVGVILVVLLGLLLVVVLQPGPAAASGPSITVHSHSGAVNAGVAQGGSTAPVSVYNSSWAVNAGPTTSTPSMNVLAGSALYVFVGYVNFIIGGGSVSSVTDTLGDSYSFVATTGLAQNHSEDLYVAEPLPSTGPDSVSVSFTGENPIGGSVAVVDVVGSEAPFVDGSATQTGAGTFASVALATNHSNDLLLLGLSGQAKDTPFTPTSGETLLATGNATSGPFEDGEGFAAFSATEIGTGAELSATLANSAVWAAIVIGLVGCDNCSAGGTTTTPTVNVAAGSMIFLFVGYVNPEIGGGFIAAVSDTAGDSYIEVATTGTAQNHTEVLFVAGPVRKTNNLSASVTMAGGATPMGSSVALVDVTGPGGLIIEGLATQSGVGGLASVGLATNQSSDLVLLGVSGQEKDSPFAPASGETLLDTAGNTTGPFEDGMGFGTFSASPTGNLTSLSASLENPAVWNAIAVGVGLASPPSSVVLGSGAFAPNSTVAGFAVPRAMRAP